MVCMVLAEERDGGERWKSVLGDAGKGLNG